MLASDGIKRGLIGPREGSRLWSRHVLNSTAVAQALPEGTVAADQPVTVCDVGSGAGLPGIPLALARPDIAVRLVEPLLRRTTFLEEVVAELAMSVNVIRGRADESTTIALAGGNDVVTARAVAPLAKLAKWCAPLLRDGGQLIALKGETAAVELDRDSVEMERYGFLHPRIEVVNVAGAEHTHLVIADYRAKLKRSEQ